MNTTKLKSFCLLVEHQKMTDVASALQVKQPTVSFHIQSLEEEIGVKLFHTHTGRYLLTEAGEAFYHYAKKIIQLEKELSIVMKEYTEGKRGALRIGASGVPAFYFIPQIFHTFMLKHPHHKLSLEVGTAPEIEALVEQHKLDCGIIMKGKGTSSPALIRKSLATDEVVLAFSTSHPIHTRNEFSIHELQDEKILVHKYTSSTKELLTSWTEEHQVKLEHIIELDSFTTIKKMITLGNCVTFISRLAIQEEVEKGVLTYRSLGTEKAWREVQLIYHGDHWNGVMMGEFFSIVGEVIKGKNDLK